MTRDMDGIQMRLGLFSLRAAIAGLRDPFVLALTIRIIFAEFPFF
ncbi:MAG TPA: hypothetical protein VGJ55_09240 [Pyrinomonadaceae bacterium]